MRDPVPQTKMRIGGKAQWIRQLQWKLKDLSSDPQNPHKTQSSYWEVGDRDRVLRGLEAWLTKLKKHKIHIKEHWSQSKELSQLTVHVCYRLSKARNKRPCFKQDREQELTPEVILWPPTCVPWYVHACMHTGTRVHTWR